MHKQKCSRSSTNTSRTLLSATRKVWFTTIPLLSLSLVLLPAESAGICPPQTKHLFFSPKTTWFLPQQAWHWLLGERFVTIRGHRKREMGLLLIAQVSTLALTHLRFIPSPHKLSQNPRNLTMSCHHVPKHGTEKKVSSLEPCHFSVKALLLVSYLLNPLIVI